MGILLDFDFFHPKFYSSTHISHANQSFFWKSFTFKKIADHCGGVAFECLIRRSSAYGRIERDVEYGGFNMNFSNNLRYLRKQRGISQDALANKLGYKSFTTIQKWESGVSEPSVSTLKIIANIFGVSMDQMINEDLSDLSQPSSSAPELELTEQEARLVGICRSLNEEGRERLVEYGDDLVASGKYRKSCEDNVVG